MEQYLYLMINIGVIIIPFLWSFGSKISFYKKWKYLMPALVLTGTFFVVWDVIFTQLGVWGFNSRYLIGISFFGLPLEELLFFITIPYACLFTYEALKYYIPKPPFSAIQTKIKFTILILVTLIALFNSGNLYTFYTGLFLAITLFISTLLQVNLGRFFFTYLIILIPFFLSNGILTGTLIEEQVVWYNDKENLGVRLGTIPVEDIFYGMLLILINTLIYDGLNQKVKKAL